MPNNVYYHPTALVESDDVGYGTRIWAYVHVLKGARIGMNCNICDHCYIESRAVIGNGVVIKNQNMIFDMVTIHDFAFIGPHVFFTNDNYPRSRELMPISRHQDESWLEPIVVERGATLGAAAIILPNTTIGEFSTVGAGALVTKNVLPHALMIGSPARQIGWVCKCGLRLHEEHGLWVCASCRRRYREAGGALRREA